MKNKKIGPLSYCLASIPQHLPCPKLRDPPTPGSGSATDINSGQRHAMTMMRR